MLLIREGSRLYSYLLTGAKSLPWNHTTYYLILLEHQVHLLKQTNISLTASQTLSAPSSPQFMTLKRSSLPPVGPSSQFHLRVSQNSWADSRDIRTAVASTVSPKLALCNKNQVKSEYENRLKKPFYLGVQHLPVPGQNTSNWKTSSLVFVQLITSYFSQTAYAKQI